MYFTVTIDFDFIGKNVRRNSAIPWPLIIRRQALSTAQPRMGFLAVRASDPQWILLIDISSLCESR
jgi:hypothetical protein